MIWMDIIVENSINDEDLRKTLHELLNIQFDKIQIVEDYDEFPDLNTMDVVCQKSLFHAGFAMMISIYLFGEIIKKKPAIDEFVSDFSTHTNSKCLSPSDNENPSQMFLFEGKKKEIVYLDETIFENEGIYKLL